MPSVCIKLAVSACSERGEVRRGGEGELGEGKYLRYERWGESDNGEGEGEGGFKEERYRV